jgi:hypothetical protein
LFVAELLRFRAATGHLPRHDELPSGIRQAIGRRVLDLDTRARRFVEAAAVAGVEAATTELASAVGMTEVDAVDAVDQAIAAHMLCAWPAPGRRHGEEAGR